MVTPQNNVPPNPNDGDPLHSDDPDVITSQSIDSDLLGELYIHHSDSPTLKLSTTLLNDRNYSRWKRSVEVSLMAKNKLGFVNGECKRPSTDPKLISKWEQCNNMLISWLVHSVEKDIAESILYYKTAAQIWKELGDRFGKSNRTNLYQIQQDLSSINQGNCSITTYFTKLKKLWDEYMLAIEDRVCSCGSNEVVLSLLKDQQIIQFLAGLNDSFNVVRSNVLLMSNSPDLGEVYKMLLQEEAQRGLKSFASNNEDATALYSHNRINSSRGSSKASDSSTNTTRSLFCDHCKGKNHTIDRCWKLHGYPTSAAPGISFCEHCKVAGHIQAKCWKIHGYPPGHKFAAPASSFTQDQMDQLLSLLNSSNKNDTDKNNHGAFLAGPFDESSLGDW